MQTPLDVRGIAEAEYFEDSFQVKKNREYNLHKVKTWIIYEKHF